MEKFKPKKMVGWFDIEQLAGTGIKAVLSSIFGSYADKRETIASISEIEWYDYSKTHADELWMDYISDMGDGFDSTYSMAQLIAQEKILVNRENTSSGKTELPRPRAVVLGGDMVYPVATREMYQDRFVGPYEQALPKDNTHPGVHMFAVPGNHDWYDGLTNFMKLFCQKRWIGNWETRQNRSYFAIKITGNTWLWAIDIQLEADIDQPQLHYFETISKQHMNEGDNVILCTAEPSWVYNTSKKADSTYKNLAFFEKKYIVDSKKKLKLILTLSGDLHHYSRYSQQVATGETSHKITAGGGGAFLHPTHNLPEKLTGLREGILNLDTTFPSKKDSKKLLWSVFKFPTNNWPFGLFLTAIYLLFIWSMYIASGIDGGNTTLFQDFYKDGQLRLNNVFSAIFHSLKFNPATLIVILIFIVGFTAFCDVNSSKRKNMWLAGTLHGLAHVKLMVMLSIVIGILYHHFREDNTPLFLILLAPLLFFTWLFSGWLTAAYLFICNRFFGIHDNEAFSSMKGEGYKNFLRMQFKDNKLTIYPVGIKNISRWGKTANGNFSTRNPVQPELIEKPIIINLN